MHSEIADNVSYPASLMALATLLSEPIGGPATPLPSIDRNIALLALRRHHTGPLLYAAASRGAHSTSQDLLTQLEQSYRACLLHQAAASTRLNAIAAIFAERNIEWMALKGHTQAQLLYADAAWRESSDIDILVSPRQFSRAAAALIGSGFIASNPPLPSTKALRAPILNLVRDVTLIARDDHSCAVELHRRPFLVSVKAMMLRPAGIAGEIPMLGVGPELGFYLIAHGAVSFWVRLKWLVDLVPLFEKLNDKEKLTIAEIARRTNTEASVAASLLLVRSLFPHVALGPLLPWLERSKSQRKVVRRLRRYAHMLALEHDWKHSPLDNALIALEANWMLFEEPLTRARMAFVALFSSLTRRAVGLLFRKDRALTRSDDPNWRLRGG